MSIKCIIIDDEPLAVNVIKNYLNQIDNFELLETFNNAIDGLSFMNDNAVDLIFLDINMPILDGLSFIKSLEKRPIIIITSAYKEFAAETYDLDVLDYLVKPISFPRFVKSVNKVNKILSVSKTVQNETLDKPFIFIKLEKKRMKKLYLDELLVVECLKDYLKLITTTENYIIHQTLGSFTDGLPVDKFLRIHRSFTISLDKIDMIEGNSVEVGGMRYVIGRTYAKNVKPIILNTATL
ncbi:LytR/AlgR family response regulator transcription factor [Urechidicola vernalis]|uniref:Response regulator transcription factor n=1 Tax=Urechidicola vernalis TaxID=3075600 RepID=A0ABU2Y4W2_9FLAO|nr:response regulator transcription factor [Urechidicola sp. P050]MDT0553236.1 response regulator transcription factor [Urechidicola sp. P050]